MWTIYHHPNPNKMPMRTLYKLQRPVRTVFKLSPPPIHRMNTKIIPTIRCCTIIFHLVILIQGAHPVHAASFYRATADLSIIDNDRQPQHGHHCTIQPNTCTGKNRRLVWWRMRLRSRKLCPHPWLVISTILFSAYDCGILCVYRLIGIVTKYWSISEYLDEPDGTNLIWNNDFDV